MHLLSAHIFLREETRFKEHYLPLTNDMFALAYRLLQDEDEAKDVVQEVLTKNIHGERSVSLFRIGNERNEFVLFSLAETYTIVVITGSFTPNQFQSFFL